MIPRSLSSLQHPLVKRLVKLRESKTFRYQERTVLLTGQTVIAELASRMKIKNLISLEPLSLEAENSYTAPASVLEKIVGLSTEDLVAAEIEMPPSSTLIGKKRIAILDQLSDPGNVGTIFRAACGLDWDGVFLLSGSVDPYNDKALRASRGTTLLLPWCEGSWEQLQALKLRLYVATLGGTDVTTVRFHEPLGLVLGHETRGPSPEALQSGEAISIPLNPRVESLNVATAAAILFYQIPRLL